MKFSYNWLAELVEGLDASPLEVSRLITRKIAESEGVEDYAPWLERVKAARVLAVEQISGSKNRVAVVDAGGGPVRVVCGAPNCRPGILTAYVPSGTSLNGNLIGKAVIAGIESDGMLASGAELGLNRDHEGILELEHDVEPGAALHLRPDHIIEIDNKSITHRPDLWGHHGMAREVAAVTGGRLLDPVKMYLLPEGEPSPVNVKIEDFALCPRYSALAFENVTVQASPLWLQYRLESIGLNPINNIVDVTNLIMSELAQPMHAFDADRLQGDTIYVRSAREGEICEALNGESYELTAANLVIADAGGPVAIAGVIGGAWSAISASTRRIVFESANFQASSVRKTSSALRLRTDASMRFEKAQDPINTTRALARAVELLSVVSPGIRVVGAVADCRTEFKAPPVINLPLDWVDQKLGRSVEPEQVRSILQSLSFGVHESAPGTFAVTVPSWRATKDIAIKDDLLEEVGRMIGYDSITPVAPVMPVTVPPANPERTWLDEVRDIAAAQGFTEVQNYSFLSEAQVRELGLNPDEHLRLLNPIAAGQDLMRASLLPGIVRNIRDNSRFTDQFQLFEVGYEIRPKPGDLPDEVPHLAAAAFAKDDSGQIYRVKAVAEAVAKGVEVRPAPAREFEHPARAGEVVWAGVVIGRIFELHPSLIPHGRAAVLDLDLNLTRTARKTEVRYRPIRRFPSSAFDLSVIADARATVASIEQRLREHTGDELERIEFVDVYQGPQVPAGKKSVSFRLTVASADHTLTSEELSQLRSRMIHSMREAGYDLRV